MKLRQICSAVLLITSIPVQVNAQVSIELEEACYMDSELTDYIVEVIQQGSSAINVVDSEGAEQIVGILGEPDNAELGTSDKLKVVLTACAEGRILQNKHARIINTATN